MKRVAAGQQSEFFEIVLNSLAEGVFTVDCDWKITSFNRAAERITGVPADEAMGQACSGVFHADICEQGCAIRESLRTRKDVIDRPARILNRKGQAVPISISTAVLMGEDDELLGAVEIIRDLSALEQLRRELGQKYTFEDIIGRSEAFQKIFAILPDVAESDSTVLIEGPSGSGKELLARAIHNLSRRKSRPYVVVNCGTLPTNLFESELFGYVRGAFTDAKADKPGRVSLAEGGTIFFDEIGDLPRETQVKLLRLLQEREYEPLGDVKPHKANVRVVAATNQKLSDLVSQGLFRDDLYFRLAVVKLGIPPLRERRVDIPYLLEHFIQRFNAKKGKLIEGLTPAAMQLVMRHDFPGNVRELENLVEHSFVLCRNRWIDVEHLPDEVVPEGQAGRAGQMSDLNSPLRQAEVDAIHAALKDNAGHLGRTAAQLGISRTTLWRKMSRHGISAHPYRSS
jgi:PAS domain S-box-containing protein